MRAVRIPCQLRAPLAIVASLALTAGLMGAGCGSAGGGSDTSTTEAAGDRALGSGATFPAAAYTGWCQESELCSYAPKGSGAGIKDLTDQTVAWAGSDAELDEDEQADIDGTVIYFPSLLGAVTVPVNLPELQGRRLNLSGKAIAGIYMGTVTRWNDPLITQDNPGVALPDQGIIACARSDASGTSKNFTAFLVKADAAFETRVGASKTPPFTPKTLANAPGGPAVAICVKSNEYAIGYVDLGDLQRADMEGLAAAIKAKGGGYVVPTVQSVSKAGALGDIPANLVLDVSDSAVKGAYPISATTYVLAVQGRSNAAAKRVFTYFLGAKAQGQLSKLGYAPLPPDLLEATTAQLAKL